MYDIILVFVLLFALSSTVIYRVAVAARTCANNALIDQIDPRADFSTALLALRKYGAPTGARAMSARAPARVARLAAPALIDRTHNYSERQ
jgi:hypothetical protein